MPWSLSSRFPQISFQPKPAKYSENSLGVPQLWRSLWYLWGRVVKHRPLGEVYHDIQMPWPQDCSRSCSMNLTSFSPDTSVAGLQAANTFASSQADCRRAEVTEAGRQWCSVCHQNYLDWSVCLSCCKLVVAILHYHYGRPWSIFYHCTRSWHTFFSSSLFSFFQIESRHIPNEHGWIYPAKCMSDFDQHHIPRLGRVVAESMSDGKAGHASFRPFPQNAQNGRSQFLSVTWTSTHYQMSCVHQWSSINDVELIGDLCHCVC